MRRVIDPLHVEKWGSSGETVILVHGSQTFGAANWERQMPLSARWRLLVIDRRGFGGSPPRPGGVDFALDAEDVCGLLADRPVHLVGHSYGGIVCLLAAAQRPEAVRSLTVIEPPAFAVARWNPAVERFFGRIRRLWPQLAGATEESFQEEFVRALGFSVVPGSLALDDGPARAAMRASMTERGPWEAVIPLEALRAAPFPKLVVRGAWDVVPPAVHDTAGVAFAVICETIASGIGAVQAVFPGAGHAPQTLGAPFNARLEAFLISGR